MQRKTAIIAIMLAAPAPVLAQSPDTGPPIASPPPLAASPAGRPYLPEYPPRARMEGREGTTYVRLNATAAGAVKECIVTRSSGHDDLDAVACRVAIRRAKIPVEAEDGKPRYYLVPVKWALEQPAEPSSPEP